VIEMKFDIDPDDGPHAGAQLSNADVEYLHRVIALEMAIRMGPEEYVMHFHGVAAARGSEEDMIEALRGDRDRMSFIAAVEADLAGLLVTSETAAADEDRQRLHP
jgi:hypothetical protein